MPTITLKAGRERSLLRRHPWIFSGAVLRADDGIAPGSTVDVVSSTGEFLGRAAYNPGSRICARVWTFADEPVDSDLLRRRIRSALQARAGQDIAASTNALRLIHAESDRLPGLIADRYDDTLVVQFLSVGANYWAQTLLDILIAETGLSRVYERSDADVRQLEGLPSQTGWLRAGDQSRVSPHLTLAIVENALRYQVDIATGHKTGFYLDQRENRKRLSELARGREVLDCFCYTGGFTINALSGGARSVLAIDSAAEALGLARENLTLNGLPAQAADFREGDVFQLLRRLRDEARTFDLVVLDPPKFAPTAAYAAQASRGYKDINLLALKLLRPNGILMTFSCSGGIDAALFQKIVAGAALDAGADAQILAHLSQAPDHPVALEFPEGAYLKGLVILKAS